MRSALVLTVSFLAGLLTLVAGAAAVSGLRTTGSREAAMPYADCLALIEEASSEAETAIRVVETAEGRRAEFEASDGLVSMSCNRAAGTVLLQGVTRSAPVLSSR